MSSSDPRDALKDMVHSLASTFKRYDRRARTKAWNSLSSSGGKQYVSKLLNSPSRPIVGVERLLKFKEWFYDHQPEVAEGSQPDDHHDPT
jgi:hypothetical protein